MRTVNPLPAVAWLALVLIMSLATATQAQQHASSFMPIVLKESFDQAVARLSADKPAVMKRHQDLLAERYDLSDRPAKGVTMPRGKPVQGGVRVKLLRGVTWEMLAGLKPQEIRRRGIFPPGFMPLPHPKHTEGGMVFPKFHIKELKKQTGRDLARFDVDFDIPDHFLPEFPPPMYLTTRPALGDVSQGKLITSENY